MLRITRLGGVCARNDPTAWVVRIQVILNAGWSCSHPIQRQVLKLGTEALDRGRGFGVDDHIPRSSHRLLGHGS